MGTIFKIGKNLFYFTAFLFIGSCSQDQIAIGENVTLDCVHQNSSGTIPSDLYEMESIIQTNEYPPFTKKLSVCGITLVARDDVSDVFMMRVGQTIGEMFSIHEETDTLKQQKLLKNLYTYHTVIPLFYGEDWSFHPDEESDWEELNNRYSICDIIMEEVPNPVMEVVEHILHHITDIGLHFTDIDNWGLTNASRLFNLTKEAIELGYYNVNQYEEINEAGIRNRVILQEYAYWIIYTSWNLRNSHGPDHSEWSIFTSSELENKLKSSYQLVQETVPSILSCPSEQTLLLFYP